MTFIFYKHDSLYTIETDFNKDVSKAVLKNAKMLLPDYMAPGNSATLHLNNHKEVFTYLSHEDLETKGVLHKDCEKFKILNCWHNTIYLDYFWLERRTGLIKWMR